MAQVPPLPKPKKPGEKKSLKNHRLKGRRMLRIKLNKVRIEDLIRKPKICVSPEEKVSSVIGKMKKHKIYAIPVKEGKKYLGLVTAQEIVSSRLPATTTEIKSLITNLPFLSLSTSIAEACEKMWRNDLRAIPIVDNEKLNGVLTFWDIVNWCLKQEGFKKLRVDNIRIRDAPVVDIHEEADKAKIKLRDKKLTKLLVYDERIDKITGVKEFVKKISKVPKESMTLGERKGEKTKRLGIETKTITKKIKVRVEENDSIKKLLRKMKKFKSSYAVVNKSIITFKDILRFLGEFKRDLITEKVTFVTDSKFYYLTWDQMKSDLKSFLETFHKKFGKESIKDFRITIRDLHKKGARTKFIMSAKLLTDIGDFYAKKEGWDPIKVFDNLMEAIRRQVWS